MLIEPGADEGGGQVATADFQQDRVRVGRNDHVGQNAATAEDRAAVHRLELQRVRDLVDVIFRMEDRRFVVGELFPVVVFQIAAVIGRSGSDGPRACS